MIDRDKLMSLSLETREVNIPSLGGTLVVRAMSLAESEKFAEVENQVVEATRFILKTCLVEPAPDDILVDHLIANAPQTVLTDILQATSSLIFGDDDDEEDG